MSDGKQTQTLFNPDNIEENKLDAYTFNNITYTFDKSKYRVCKHLIHEPQGNCPVVIHLKSQKRHHEWGYHSLCRDNDDIKCPYRDKINTNTSSVIKANKPIENNRNSNKSNKNIEINTKQNKQTPNKRKQKPKQQIKSLKPAKKIKKAKTNNNNNNNTNAPDNSDDYDNFMNETLSDNTNEIKANDSDSDITITDDDNSSENNNNNYTITHNNQGASSNAPNAPSKPIGQINNNNTIVYTNISSTIISNDFESKSNSATRINSNSNNNSGNIANAPHFERILWWRWQTDSDETKSEAQWLTTELYKEVVEHLFANELGIYDISVPELKQYATHAEYNRAVQKAKKTPKIFNCGGVSVKREWDNNYTCYRWYCYETDLIYLSLNLSYNIKIDNPLVSPDMISHTSIITPENLLTFSEPNHKFPEPNDGIVIVLALSIAYLPNYPKPNAPDFYLSPDDWVDRFNKMVETQQKVRFHPPISICSIYGDKANYSQRKNINQFMAPTVISQNFLKHYSNKKKFEEHISQLIHQLEKKCKQMGFDWQPHCVSAFNRRGKDIKTIEKMEQYLNAPISANAPHPNIIKTIYIKGNWSDRGRCVKRFDTNEIDLMQQFILKSIDTFLPDGNQTKFIIQPEMIQLEQKEFRLYYSGQGGGCKYTVCTMGKPVERCFIVYPSINPAIQPEAQYLVRLQLFASKVLETGIFIETPEAKFEPIIRLDIGIQDHRLYLNEINFQFDTTLFCSYQDRPICKEIAYDFQKYLYESFK